MKPVLYWGIVRGSIMSSQEYRAIRVTRDAGYQISGVRDGDVGAVTLRKFDLVGRYESLEAAQGAIKHAGRVRAPYQAQLEELRKKADSIRKSRDDHEKKVFAEYPGSLKDA